MFVVNASAALLVMRDTLDNIVRNVPHVAAVSVCKYLSMYSLTSTSSQHKSKAGF